METTLSSPSLTSLTAWSMQHMHNIFEAPSDEEALRAIDETFAKNIEASANGKPVRYNDIIGMVLALRKGSRLKVSWQQARELPLDASTNRGGVFSGAYIIRGIQRILPGANHPVEFERHKTVEVLIEPQSKDISIDSRKIVKLTFVASDIRVHRQASL
ncbi:hypothetical protein P691DRAFT_709115 [Macrolepiota fuliginosa MF-IS2]|uniref:Uncharacterized protein n=1 Tax=Macrolepiota fuliginosa MF-IS2 TaxID=1400762 RepID=A0A9P6C1Y8_9AGAR|nr:hypothetical protein P691DRAFT_709115 [Macrolepiota fuliginosa MF-IS2]